jgi:hypothetical protein
MINSAADYNSNARDKVVINPVYIKKKPDKLKKIKNKTSKNDFCYSYGIYIVMAALLTALIALNIALYIRVSKIETSNHGIIMELKKLDGSLQNFKLETKNELVGNLESTKREISKSAIQIINETNSNRKFLFSLLKTFNLVNNRLEPGIQNNVKFSKYAGFGVVYNKTYDHQTISTEIETIRNSCLPTTILCLGGANMTEKNLEKNVFRVIACGFCSVVLSKTVKNKPTLHNGVYWYYTPDHENSRSMGFAPNSSINQEQSDSLDINNDQRVSWHLDGYNGGYRLGSLIHPKDYINYYKFIIRKHYLDDESFQK